MDEMLQAYKHVMTEATELTLSRGERNNIVPLRDMFVHGITDLSFMLHMKTSRLLGNETIQNWVAVRDEALDICNYAAFLVAYMDIEGFIPDYSTPSPHEPEQAPDDESTIHDRLVKAFVESLDKITASLTARARK